MYCVINVYTLMYGVIANIVLPLKLKNRIRQTNERTQKYNSRQCESRFVVPRVETNMGVRTLSVAVPTQCNSFPTSVNQ